MKDEFDEFNRIMMIKFELLKKKIQEEIKKPKDKQDWDKLEKEMFKLGVFT